MPASKTKVKYVGNTPNTLIVANRPRSKQPHWLQDVKLETDRKYFETNQIKSVDKIGVRYAEFKRGPYIALSRSQGNSTNIFWISMSGQV